MSAKRRRSKRIDKSERVLLNLATPTAVQDIVLTIEVSSHGAKVLARRKMVADAKGSARLLSAGREVPCRVAWQRPPGKEGRMETGLEIYSNTNFWGLDLSGSEIAPEPVEAPPPAALEAPAPPSAAALLEALDTKANPAQLPVELWCALVDSLEAKGVFTRQELIGMLRQLGKG